MNQQTTGQSQAIKILKEISPHIVLMTSLLIQAHSLLNSLKRLKVY